MHEIQITVPGEDLVESPSAFASACENFGENRQSTFVSLLPLESPRLLLRPMRAADAEVLYSYRADPTLARYQGWSAISLEEARAFVERQALERKQIAIERKDTGEMIGDVYLNTPTDDLAEVGFTVSTTHQGQGFATEAVRTLIDGVFTKLDVRRITALTFAENKRSVALLQRVGMRREAHYVESSEFEGRWVDDYRYALLRSEWASGRPRS